MMTNEHAGSSVHQPIPKRHNKWCHFDDQHHRDDMDSGSENPSPQQMCMDAHAQFKKIYLNLPQPDPTLRLSSPPPPSVSPMAGEDNNNHNVEDGPVQMPLGDLDHRHEHLPPGMVSLWDGRMLPEDEVAILLGVYSDVDLRQEEREGFVILRRRVIVIEKGERVQDRSQCFQDSNDNDHPPLYYPPIIIDSYE